ncbi:hypothetical protein IEQ34_020155 [Dendrobium chrysotoxum]|uniref:E2 ubiquitin-conjugating enzyme n=1 Tax=Dendrobium chrysotoxum TaxID=161865 RepID=A0AAV7G1U1_DENCH|nr:hypothetical protein IEQ34_020155 [Dendrobium chrysotoxum]
MNSVSLLSHFPFSRLPAPGSRLPSVSSSPFFPLAFVFRYRYHLHRHRSHLSSSFLLISRENEKRLASPETKIAGFPGRPLRIPFLAASAACRMSTPARKRLMRDFKRLQQDPPAGISGAPQDNNIMLWNAVIFGPDDTPWDGGTFKLTLQFTEDYPNKPPTVRFVSRMFHPNIYADGSICLDILQNQWSPIYDVAAILTSIQSLLCDPNPNSPANSEAARMFSENKREYNRRVREIVEQSWTAD